MAKKTCKDCGQSKPLSHFHFSDMKTGIKKSYCDKCSTKRTQASRNKPLEGITGYYFNEEIWDENVKNSDWYKLQTGQDINTPKGQPGPKQSYAPKNTSNMKCTTKFFKGGNVFMDIWKNLIK